VACVEPDHPLNSDRDLLRMLRLGDDVDGCEEPAPPS
jgi:hypothetical protein